MSAAKQTTKNGRSFILPADLSEESEKFYSLRYPRWEQPSFWVYDHFSDENKVFIDIGGWNGCTAIYAALINKHVVSLEPDPVSLKDYHNVIAANNVRNVTLIEKPLYSRKTTVYFSPFDDKWNTSQSHITPTKKEHSKSMTSAAWSDIEAEVERVTGNAMSSRSISLVKIDIEGNEQYLCETLSQIDPEIPLYISFHHEWWNGDGDLEPWRRLLWRYEHIYATTSYGQEGRNPMFEKIKRTEVAKHIRDHPFTSLVLASQCIAQLP